MSSKIVREAMRAAKAKAVKEQKARASRIVPIDEILSPNSHDWPHINQGGKWKADSQFGVVCEYGQKLREAGVKDSEISIMFRDLFWACYRELDANKMIKGKKL
jgi:hypothetical protein